MSAKRTQPSRTLEMPLLEDKAREANERQACKMHWVGMEIESSWTWLYFEIELPKVVERLQLENRVLFEVNESQINTCVLRTGTQKQSLRTDIQNPSVLVPVVNH